jgi:general stress protein YciG
VAGNKLGGQKAHASLRQRLGEEKYREHMANIGAKGGKAKVPKGLSFTRNLPNFAQYYHKPRPQYREDLDA